jgi:hypothetical protein
MPVLPQLDQILLTTNVIVTVTSELKLLRMTWLRRRFVLGMSINLAEESVIAHSLASF